MGVPFRQRTAPAYNGSNLATAQWQFDYFATNPPVGGEVDVYVTWAPLATYATSAPFLVTNTTGGQLGLHAVNFTQAPGGASAVNVAGRTWQYLGRYGNLTGGFRVKLSNQDANGPIIADGVLIVNPALAPMAPTDLELVGSRLTWMHPADMMLGVDGFEIQRSKTGLGEDWQLWADINDPSAMATDPQTDRVSDQETYFFRIRATSFVRGPSDWSTPVERVDSLENQVVKLSAIVSTNPSASITLVWLVQKDHLQAGDVYDVQRKQLGEQQWMSLATNLTIPMDTQNTGRRTWTD